ncbi:MAG: hypothetical protein QOG63_2917 [Thermoleophilaceae bacterium]|jgi:hypothetical protein|nr:hypothetical protein [Thermoleophilaceae bacterium]
MRTSLSTEPGWLTRRGLLRAGGLAGAAALVGVRPWAPASASAAAADGTPAHLLRTSWVWLQDAGFKVDGSTAIKLVAVSDLPVAATVKELSGSEDAFALTFYGPAGIEQGVRSFTNSELGTVDLFVAPDSAVGTSYSVVINRSVGAAKHFPKPPKAGDARPGASNSSEGPERLRRANRRRWVKQMRARRTAKGVACAVALAPGIEAKTVTFWLTRGRRSVASGSARVNDHRAVARVRTKRRLRAGRYQLNVLAFDRHGNQHGRSERVTLR